MSSGKFVANQFRDDIWLSEDKEKAKFMLRQRKTDGTRRYSNADVAAYFGMPERVVAAIERTIPPGGRGKNADAAIKTPDRILFNEEQRMRDNAIDGSRRLAERMRAVHG